MVQKFIILCRKDFYTQTTIFGSGSIDFRCHKMLWLRTSNENQYLEKGADKKKSYSVKIAIHIFGN